MNHYAWCCRVRREVEVVVAVDAHDAVTHEVTRSRAMLVHGILPQSSDENLRSATFPRLHVATLFTHTEDLCIRYDADCRDVCATFESVLCWCCVVWLLSSSLVVSLWVCLWCVHCASRE